MPRIIEGQELQTVQSHLEYAKTIGSQSNCQKDQRGVVIFRNNQILSSAYNGPELPDQCQGSDCFTHCGLIAIHAERRAVIAALRQGIDLNDASLLHLRVEDDSPQISGQLRCEDCSGFLLRATRRGIRLHEFILLQSDGLTAYTISEMNQLTRANLKLT